MDQNITEAKNMGMKPRRRCFSVLVVLGELYIWTKSRTAAIPPTMLTKLESHPIFKIPVVKSTTTTTPSARVIPSTLRIWLRGAGFNTVLPTAPMVSLRMTAY